jgi:uncharacterized membrane protein YraQ (UPF0718 family)
VLGGAVYTDSLGSLPWVQALLQKGLGAGSAIALLVTGVGTNLPTLGPISRTVGWHTAAVYAASVVTLTGMLGLGLNLDL